MIDNKETWRQFWIGAICIVVECFEGNLSRMIKVRSENIGNKNKMHCFRSVWRKHALGKYVSKDKYLLRCVKR